MKGTKEEGTPEEEDTRFSVNARQALSTSIFWRMWLAQVCLAVNEERNNHLYFDHSRLPSL